MFFARPRRLFLPGMPQRPSTWWRGHGVQLTSRCLADGFLFASKKNGEDKKTWKIWDWAKVWWWDSAHGYGQGRHEGPQFGCFNISSFESLSPLITLISFALRAFRLVPWHSSYKAIRAFLTGQEHHSNLVPWQQLAESNGAKLKFGRLLSNGTLEPWISRCVFVTVHEMHEIHDTWQPKDIEHFESLINERMARRLRECFLTQWNTETVAVLCSITWCSKIHKFLMQVKLVNRFKLYIQWFNQFWSMYVDFGRSSQTGRSWWDFVTSPMYWAVLILSNVSPRSAIPSTQSWWWMPVKVCCCHVFLAILGAKDVVTWDVSGCQVRKQDCMIWPLIGLKPNSLEATCSCKFHCSFQHWPGSVLGVEFTCHRCLTCQLMFRAWEQTG